VKRFHLQIDAVIEVDGIDGPLDFGARLFWAMSTIGKDGASIVDGKFSVEGVKPVASVPKEGVLDAISPDLSP
jgi:hypothetical protein